MNGYQIKQAMDIIPETQNFRGCFYNKNIPFEFLGEKECFFIVNSVTDLRKMGHWVLFYIKSFHLYFFDSFGLHPSEYGWDIGDFFEKYPLRKTIVFENAIQNDFSFVCGAYVIIFSYLTCKNYSIRRIKSLFSKNTRKNDSFIASYLYSLIGITISCNQMFCPNYMFFSNCRKFCKC